MAFTPTKLQGFKSKFATVLASVATNVASLQDVDVNIKLDKIDASDHDNAGWKSFMTGLAEWSATAKFMYVAGDVTQSTLKTAMLGQTLLNFQFFPVTLSGAPSFTGSGYITDYKWTAGNSNAQAVDITIAGFGPLLDVVQV